MGDCKSFSATPYQQFTAVLTDAYITPSSRRKSPTVVEPLRFMSHPAVAIDPVYSVSFTKGSNRCQLFLTSCDLVEVAYALYPPAFHRYGPTDTSPQYGIREDRAQ